MDTSKIEDYLECSVCLELLDERSRVLPCQHTFCLKCLGIVLENKGHLQCPECRSSFQDTSINDLPRNVLLIRILEGLKNKRLSTDSLTSNGGGSNRNSVTEQVRSRHNSKRLSVKDKCEALLNQPSARGLYNFISSEDGDLQFSKGDMITLLHEVDDNWLEGILKGKRGLIPKTFVEILVPLPKIDDDTNKAPFAKAVYSYGSKEEELISFKEGDMIGVIKKVDANWLEGILGGQYGIFPVNFMRLNKAAKEIMSAETSSSGSGSSSDEDTEEKRKRKSRRKPRQGRAKQQPSPWIKMNNPQSVATGGASLSTTDSSTSLAASSSTLEATPETSTVETSTAETSTTETSAVSSESACTTEQAKRHTIHIENPNEQRRQSRRALNLSDELDQSRERLRTQSQGRRASESSVQERSLATSVLLNRALRTSDEELTTTAPSTTTPTSSRPDVSLTFSTCPSSNTPSPLEPGASYTALFHYSPSQDDELALIPGDQYCVIEKHLDGWFKGVHTRSGQAGVIPGNYVKLTSQVTSQMLRIGYGSNPSSPIVQSGEETCFTFPWGRHEVIETETVSFPVPKRTGKVSGLFKKLKKSKLKRPQTPTVPQPPSSPQTPPSYYHSSMPAPAHHRLSRPSPMLPAEPPPPYTPSPAIETNALTMNEKFRAIATYPANHEQELSLRVGDVIYVSKKHLDGWFTGKSTRTGATGVFPATFVESME